MSALLDDAPVYTFPEVLTGGGSQRPALRLVPGDQPPAQRSPALRPAASAAPLRLTRRGVAVLTAAVGVLAAVLVALAWLSAPSAGTATAPTMVGNTVAVAPGDSLWSIATRVAPNRDPRAEVALLQRLNHLAGPDLVPGQVLRVH